MPSPNYSRPPSYPPSINQPFSLSDLAVVVVVVVVLLVLIPMIVRRDRPKKP